MTNTFLIVDHPVQMNGKIHSELLAGFEYDSENTSAPDSRGQEPICSVSALMPETIHGVEKQTPDFPVSHVLTISRDPTAVLIADDRFERVRVRAYRPEGTADLLLVAISSRLAYYHTVFVHGALIDVPDYGGILFIGRSGVGKTTQAELWAAHRGAEILNGDKVFLAVREEHPDTVFAYGSPWNGSSPYRVNRRVPLRAVIDLNREEEHYIRPLDELGTLAACMPSVFMPNWDIRLTEQVMDTLDALLPRVPFYRMSCTKDITAVEMAARALGME